MHTAMTVSTNCDWLDVDNFRSSVKEMKAHIQNTVIQELIKTSFEYGWDF